MAFHMSDDHHHLLWKEVLSVCRCPVSSSFARLACLLSGRPTGWAEIWIWAVSGVLVGPRRLDLSQVDGRLGRCRLVGNLHTGASV